MNYILVPNEVLSTVVDGKPYVIQAAHPNFRDAVQAVKEGRFEDIPALAKIANTIRQFVQGKLEVDEAKGCVLYNDKPLHNYAAVRLMEMMREGFDVDPLVKFLENLMQNPSARAVEELYQFIEYGRMPITPDGCFLAYKRVNADYTSVYDNKTDNSIGKIVEMDRNRVDDRSHNTCSHGLHFCSVDYLRHYTGYRTVVLKINPRDVVSIPTDYNNTKGRACRYEVIGELTQDEVNTALGGTSVWDRPVVDDYDVDFDFRDYDDADRDYDDADGDYTSDYRDGYATGYKDGRAKSVRAISTLNHDWDSGYEDGYKDGKGHKPRKVR